MTPEKERLLFDRFPNLFDPSLPKSVNLMCYGFTCGDGWFDLIYKLCLDIEKIGIPDDFIVMQVKEKFAGLRFYANNGNDKIQALIDEAECESLKTCESCGSKKDVSILRGGWIKTLCLSCKERR